MACRFFQERRQDEIFMASLTSSSVWRETVEARSHPARATSSSLCGVGFERTASFPNGRELRHDAVRHEFLAVDAADFCRTAFFVDLVDDR